MKQQIQVVTTGQGVANEIRRDEPRSLGRLLLHSLPPKLTRKITPVAENTAQLRAQEASPLLMMMTMKAFFSMLWFSAQRPFPWRE
jgi:hypothetical protein